LNLYNNANYELYDVILNDFKAYFTTRYVLRHIWVFSVQWSRYKIKNLYMD